MVIVKIINAFVLMVIQENIVKKNYNVVKIAYKMVYAFMEFVIANKVIQDRIVNSKYKI